MFLYRSQRFFYIVGKGVSISFANVFLLDFGFHVMTSVCSQNNGSDCSSSACVVFSGASSQLALKSIIS